ncbi:MAG: histidine--tRNA ligase [Clostridia bacterium]|nr:histidine--tRNA ligase [Clostridia bacterium]
MAKLIKTPVKGMSDMLPADMRLREHVLALIKENYARYGFSQIETPCMEHIENLTSKQGGENEKLIFKVMKRGAELERAMQDENGELADFGMRYDLTVPLSRYYANHSAELPSPFKALQIGAVWRADRPQKGRFRQFTQCDIDILGDDSVLSEIELLTATSSTLQKIFEEADIHGFTLHVNDRRILRAMAAYAGFAEEDYDTVFIELDKMDKIGRDGVRASLLENGFAEASVDTYLSLFDGDTENLRAFAGKMTEAGVLEASVLASLETILACVRPMVSSDVKIVFDPTLVRGMSYYTGTIFEVTLDRYNFSIAGGGRYDEMIGKFSGQRVPACGFSIGFERIVTILKDVEAEKKAEEVRKVAFLLENGMASDKMRDVFARAAALRAEGVTVTVQPLKKNAKFQIDRWTEDGYTEIERIYCD